MSAGPVEVVRHRLEGSVEVEDRTIAAADVHPIPISWLWDRRVPLGMLTVFTGLPGAGKSTILYDLAARTSREGRTVLIVTAEDHLAAVVRPRLEAAGADLALVRIVTCDITLPGDVAMLADLVREFGSVMVMLDPLVAFIGDGVNTHRDHHVRRVLAPLGNLAESTGAAVIVVIHTNKGTGSDPLLRISGSVGFGGAARSVVVAAEDPNDEERRIFGAIKSNLAELPPPLAYRLVGVDLGEGITTSRVEWQGEAPEVDMRDLLSVPDPEERTARDDAIEFLRESGVLTTARPAKALEKEAAALGIKPKTLQRARRSLGVPAWRDGYQGPYFWGPRDESNPDTQPGHSQSVQVVQVEADLREQGSKAPNLDTAQSLEESGCPECGAASTEPGYNGHGMHCRRFYPWRSEAPGA